MLKSSFENKITKLILKYRKNGYNEYQIKLALIRQHYPSNIIHDLLAKAKAPEKKEHHFNLVYTLIVIILIIPLLTFTSFKLFTPKYEPCSNIFCFLAVSNNCGKAIYTQEIEGTVFLLKTSNCELIKQVKEISSNEPQEIKSLLKDKSMKCKYNKIELPEELVTSVSKSLEYCDGELKDIILSIKDQL